MKTHWKKKIFLLSLAAVLLLSACSLLDPPSGNVGFDPGRELKIAEEVDETTDTGFVLTGPGSFDSVDTAVLVGKDEKEGTVTLLNLELGRRYTLAVEGTTILNDKYGQALSLEQIKEGDIVDVTFLRTKKRLTSMQLSKDAWSYDSINRYEIDILRQDMMIGQNIYKITKNTLFYSSGKQVELMDLNSADILTVNGLGSNVVSVFVERGHGYLRLANDDYFIGGWIEIGQWSIRRITEDMLLTVPEGRYQINISHNGGGGVKDVIINRSEEIVLDIGDLEVAEIKYGTVLFSLSPSSASLYIDGTKVDISQPVTLEYGIHQLIARSSGYKSVTSYLRVGEETAGIDITLEPVDPFQTDSSDKDDDDDDNDNASTTTSYYRVFVDAPEGVEVYLDGNYVGISPCNFRKVSGTHVITLRKNGYVTRSYTVQVDQEEKDISYSFADLVLQDPQMTGTGNSSLTGTGNSSLTNSGNSSLNNPNP